MKKSIDLFVVLLVLTAVAQATTLHWQGGSGNWDSSNWTRDGSSNSNALDDQGDDYIDYTNFDFTFAGSTGTITKTDAVGGGGLMKLLSGSWTQSVGKLVIDETGAWSVGIRMSSSGAAIDTATMTLSGTAELDITNPGNNTKYAMHMDDGSTVTMSGSSKVTLANSITGTWGLAMEERTSFIMQGDANLVAPTLRFNHGGSATTFFIFESGTLTLTDSNPVRTSNLGTGNEPSNRVNFTTTQGAGAAQLINTNNTNTGTNLASKMATGFFCIDGTIVNDTSTIVNGYRFKISSGGGTIDILTIEDAGDKAYSPSPSDGAVGVAPTGDVSWDADSAASYDVWFAKDGQTLTFVGNYTVKTVSMVDLAQAIGLTALEDNNEYDWRVDTKDGGGGLLDTGDLWNFKTMENFNSHAAVVDDFFDYADTAELLAVWSESSSANLTAEPLTNIMQFDYDNSSSPYKSEATMTISPAGDWSGLMATSMDLKLLGQIGNSADPIYVIVGDGTNSHKIILTDAVVDSNDRWQVLSIKLSELVDVNLANITTLTVGVGDGVSAGGAGTVFINDILLYGSRCMSEYADIADVTGDCQVTLDDLAMITGQWLFADFNVAATAPAASPVAYYNFNDASGYTADDSSGNNYDAAIQPGTASGFWDSSGYSGYCISLSDPNIEVNMPAAVFSTVSDEVTISMWLYGAANSVPDPIQTVEAFAGTGPPEDPNNDWDRLQWDIVSDSQYESQWNHYAIVKDADANSMQIFVNGVLVARKTYAPAAMSGSTAGTTILSMVPGHELSTVKVDELRVFNDALSQAEIVYLAKSSGGEATQPISPVLTDADIITDGVVNLKDVAQIASAWLDDQSW